MTAICDECGHELESNGSCRTCIDDVKSARSASLDCPKCGERIHTLRYVFHTVVEAGCCHCGVDFEIAIPKDDQVPENFRDLAEKVAKAQDAIFKNTVRDGKPDRLLAASLGKCPRCGSDPDELHPCPFDEEFDEDGDAELCSCCEACTQDCAYDI